jgi:L-ascorbate metabolism protein UlaG (beta-lactamase superfamily)
MTVRVLLFLLIALNPMAAGLSRYSDFVVSDPRNRPPDRESVRITYLGTNGYQFETAGHSLLVDPYFSRISLARAGLGWPVRPNSLRIEEGLTHVSPKVDAILITHAHFDHLLDAPNIAERTGARLLGSVEAVEIAVRMGAAHDHCVAVRPDAIRTIGPWHITVFPAAHDRIPIMGVPFNGPLPADRPRRARDWVCGQPLAYLIRANGQSIFIDSGGTAAVLPPAVSGSIDLAILGTALPDSRARLVTAVTRLHPRYVLPSHQDNFFLPLARGFVFGPLTNFPSVRQQYEAAHLPGRLILLDYFRPWTLPPS